LLFSSCWLVLIKKKEDDLIFWFRNKKEMVIAYKANLNAKKNPEFSNEYSGGWRRKALNGFSLVL
jgi:hypothetical protein